MFLGPVIPTRCKACGGKVAVSYGKSLAAIAVMLPAFGAISLRTHPAVILLLAAGGAILACILYRYWVPLEARS